MSNRHHHERMQYATAPGILVIDVERRDPVTGLYTPFDSTGWDLFFRMWTYARPGRCDGETLIVEDREATQPAVGQLLYMPRAEDVVAAGDFRGVFHARRDSDGATDFWPVQTITIHPVAGAAPEAA